MGEVESAGSPEQKKKLDDFCVIMIKKNMDY